VQAAHAAGRTKTYRGAQVRRLSRSRGTKRAAAAVAHRSLVIYYHMLCSGRAYGEQGEDDLLHRDQSEQQQRLVKQLEHLGYEVRLAPRASA
jgi:transposase